MHRFTIWYLSSAVLFIAVTGCPTTTPPPEDGDPLTVDMWTETYYLSYSIMSSYSLAQAPDGGFVMATADGLLKVDEHGRREWLAPTGEDWPAERAVVSRGGGYVIGKTEGELEVRNMQVIKFNENGEEVWSSVFGGSDLDNFRDLRRTSDGGYVVLGVFAPPVEPGSIVPDFEEKRTCLVKISSSGQEEWTRIYDVKYELNLTEDSTVDAATVVQARDGGYFVVGGAGESLFNPDGYAMKTDSAGDIEWITPFAAELLLSDVCVTSNGDYAVIGSTSVMGAGGYDIYFALLDNKGNVVVEQSYGGTRSDYGKGLEPTDDGGFILVGTYATGTSLDDAEEFMNLIKTDSNGAEEWSRLYRLEGQDFTNGLDVCVTDDGGYAALGGGFYWDPLTQRVIGFYHLVKTDAQGNGD